MIKKHTGAWATIQKTDEFLDNAGAQKVYALGLTSFGITEDSQMEAPNLLRASREAVKGVRGLSSFAGAAGFPLTAYGAGLWAYITLGKPNTAVANHSADAWAATMLIDTGDVVNHSDGIHGLTALKGGTTGATEPDLSAFTGDFGGDGNIITDETVEWMIVPLLGQNRFKVQNCVPPFILEVADSATCDVAPDTEYEKYFGTRIQTASVSLASGSVFATGEPTVVANSMQHSAKVIKDGGTYAPLATMPNTTNVYTIPDNLYGVGEADLYINNVLTAGKVIDFAINVNNNISTVNTIGRDNKSINFAGNIGVEINFKAIYDKDDFIAAYEDLESSAKIVLRKPNGCSMTIEIANFTMAKPSKTRSNAEPITVSYRGMAYADNDKSTIEIEVVAPKVLLDI